MWMHEVEARCVLTTSNVSVQPTLEFSMHHFSFTCIIDAKKQGKVISVKGTNRYDLLYMYLLTWM
jgi:hypothetical protein